MGLFDKNQSNTTNNFDENNNNILTDSRGGDNSIFGGNTSVNAKNSNVSITNTDYGAIAAAAEMNANNNDLALTTSELAIDAAQGFAARTFDLADAATNKSLDMANSTFTGAMSMIERDATASRQQFANQVSKAYDLASLHSRSEGGEALDKAVKVMAWGGAGLGALFVFSQYMKSKK